MKKSATMKRPPLDVLELSGSSTDLTYELGKRRKKKIEDAVCHWNQTINKAYRGKRDLLRNMERAFFEEAKTQCPSFLEEIHALSEGASVSFRDLFRLNLTELIPYAEKCTDLIFHLRTQSGKKILLAHNEDWDPKRNDIFVLKATLPQCTYVTIAFNGYLPGLSAGRNSFGLCHSVNYLRPRDLRVGLPRIFITRFLLTSSSIKDCLQFIGAKKRAFGQSIHLAQGNNYVNLELTARKTILRRPALPTVHSNHYLSRTLKNRAPQPSTHSIVRQKTAQLLLKRRLIPKTGLTSSKARSLAKAILSDRSGHPFAIWREADTSAETSATLATAILGTDREEMEIHRHPSSHSQGVLVNLETEVWT